MAVVADMLEVADMVVPQLEVTGAAAAVAVTEVAPEAMEVAPEVTEVAQEVTEVVQEVMEVAQEVTEVAAVAMAVVPAVMEERLMEEPKALFSSNRLAMMLEEVGPAAEEPGQVEPELDGNLRAEAAVGLQQGGNPLEGVAVVLAGHQEVAVVLAGHQEVAAAVPVAGPLEGAAEVVLGAGPLEVEVDPVEPAGNPQVAVGVEAVAGGELGSTKLSRDVVSSSTRIPLQRQILPNRGGSGLQYYKEVS
ncbi:hypothetical protein ISCGN_000567 [Ixodes scapularis]